MKNDADLYYVQWARADGTRTRGLRWRTCLWTNFETRADAEEVKAVSEKYANEIRIIERVTLLGRLRRRLGQSPPQPPELEGLKNLRGQPAQVVGSAKMIYRVVSTSELRAESAAALREAEKTTILTQPAGVPFYDQTPDDNI